MRANKIIENYKLDNKFFINICYSMGLNLTTGKLIESGPIALRSRKEVINKVLDYLKNLDCCLNYQEIDHLFYDVHNEFSLIMYDFIKPIDPCIDLIKRLYEAEIKLSLITSDTTKNAEIVCEKLNLTSYFEYIIGGDANVHKKSSGHSANYVCKNMNLNNKNVICIGDTPVDYEMANNSNLKGALLVESGQIPLSTLLKFSKYSVKNLSEIIIE